MSWEQAWEEGRTPWDASAPAPALVDLVRGGTLPRGRALVPGAGSGHDVLALARPGSEVIGLDLSPLAVQRFDVLRAEAGVAPASARVVVADFFEYAPPTPFELIWDYTFLCAIEPDRRPEWARQMDRLLAPHGELITLIFPTRPYGDPGGPPFTVDEPEVCELLAPFVQQVAIEPDPRGHPGREGYEILARWRRGSG